MNWLYCEIEFMENLETDIFSKYSFTFINMVDISIQIQKFVCSLMYFYLFTYF